MIKRTDEEILSLMNELWAECNNKVDSNKAKEVLITTSQMYEQPTLTFAMLKRLSEFFGTENINDDDRFSERGCPTCDYGSCHGFTLRIYEAG